MDGDPNFRLKAFAVIACVVGVFLVCYVLQRLWFWLVSNRRPDIETSRIAPVIDFGLLGLGALIIWIAVEALALAVVTSGLPVQPQERSKIAEIEIGKQDQETGQLNLLFYPVDRAGMRIPEQRRPVLTSGDSFELQVEVLRWRAMWGWLGESGFYQFISLGGYGGAGGASPERTVLDSRIVGRGIGATLFLREPGRPFARQAGEEGEIYSIYLDGAGTLQIERQVD